MNEKSIAENEFLEELSKKSEALSQAFQQVSIAVDEVVEIMNQARPAFEQLYIWMKQQGLVE